MIKGQYNRFNLIIVARASVSIKKSLSEQIAFHFCYTIACTISRNYEIPTLHLLRSTVGTSSLSVVAI